MFFMSVCLKEAWTLAYFIFPVNAVAMKTCFFLRKSVFFISQYIKAAMGFAVRPVRKNLFLEFL